MTTNNNWKGFVVSVLVCFAIYVISSQQQNIATVWTTQYKSVNYPNWWDIEGIGFDLSLTTYVDDDDRVIFVIQTNDTFIEENNVVQNWMLCPNNTNHIVSTRMYNGSYSSSGPVFEHTLGCCPIGQMGCIQPGEDRVLGCCPEDTYCVIDNGGDSNIYNRKFGSAKFLGCVPDQAFLCPGNIVGNSRCPMGYGCCSNPRKSYCMPINSNATDGFDYDNFCGEPFEQEVRSWTIRAAKTLGLDGTELYPATWNWTYNAIINATSPFNTDPGLETYGGLRRCVNSTYFCHADETCILGNSPFSANASFVVEDMQLFCFPSHYYAETKGWTELETLENLVACYQGPLQASETMNLHHPDYPGQTINIDTYPGPLGNNSLNTPLYSSQGVANNYTFITTSLLGFADTTEGETCCGRSICQDQQKCCSVKIHINLNETYNNHLVDSGMRFCCPNELECCYGLPPGWTYPSDNVPLAETVRYTDSKVPGYVGRPFQNGFYGYCGMTVNGQQCAMDRMISSQIYALDRNSAYVV